MPVEIQLAAQYIYQQLMERAKRILVTGATGFIGSYVCRHLVQDGYEVHVTKRKSSRLHLIETVLDQISIHEIALDDITGLEDVF